MRTAQSFVCLALLSRAGEIAIFRSLHFKMLLANECVAVCLSKALAFTAWRDYSSIYRESSTCAAEASALNTCGLLVAVGFHSFSLVLSLLRFVLLPLVIFLISLTCLLKLCCCCCGIFPPLFIFCSRRRSCSRDDQLISVALGPFESEWLVFVVCPVTAPVNHVEIHTALGFLLCCPTT